MKKDSTNEIGMGGGIIGGVFTLFLAVTMALAMLVFAVLSLLAGVLTMLSLLAWNDDLEVFGYTIDRDGARLFIGRGVIGMIALPGFIAFCGLLYGFSMPEGWPALMLIGYVLGSAGIEVFLHCTGGSSTPLVYQDHYANVLPPPASPPPVHQQALLPAPRGEPFRYASWDDEEARQ
ncbi:hypothetical protein [Oricola indica]|uniref:hypothetical protein n=1 Tax=Oricola indica TaxID=2872591 RepID=UPI001CC12A0D|nr:hypothetical protein [Oricola indica]